MDEDDFGEFDASGHTDQHLSQDTSDEDTDVYEQEDDRYEDSDRDYEYEHGARSEAGPYSYDEDDGYEESDHEVSDLDEGSNEEERLQAQVDDEAMASAIMTSIGDALDPGVKKPALPIRMTDLGLRISQMVIMKNRGAEKRSGGEEEDDDADYESVLPGPGTNEDGGDMLLERTLSGRRKNRTGVRGRPKKIDFGFGRSTTVKLAPEVAKLMGQANMAFVQRRYDEASAALLEVIRQSPSSHESYLTLGLLYEETGELGRAFSYFLLAAHLTKGDLEAWNKLTQLAVRLGRRRETVYCLSKVLSTGCVQDARPFWVRSRLYLELRSYRNTIWGFADLLRRSGGSIEQWQTVAKLALRLNLSYEAARMFGSLFDKALHGRRGGGMRPSDVTWSHLNLQLEMYVAGKNYEGAVAAVERHAPAIYAHSRRSLAADALLGGAPTLETILHHLPLDIKEKLAVAYVSMGAQPVPYGLDSICGDLDVATYGDLRVELGDAYVTARRPESALVCYIPLLENPQYGDVALCLKIGKAYAALGQWEDAVGVLAVAWQLEPERAAVRVALADAYRSMGQPEAATRILGDATDDSAAGMRADEAVDLDPASIYTAVYGSSADVALLYGFGFGGEQAMDEEYDPALASLLRLPNIRSSRQHPALRKIKRRPRRLVQVRFGASQIEAAQNDYQRCRIYYAQATSGPEEVDYAAADNCLKVSTGLTDDLLSNTYLCTEERFRGLAPQVREDIGALHGLTVEEWHDVVEMHCILLVRAAGVPDRALRLLRRLASQSVWAHDPVLAPRIHLLQLALAQHAGRHIGALIGSRWFVTRWPNTYGPALLFSLVAHVSDKASLVRPSNYRPLSRHARLHPDNLAYHLLPAHMALARSFYEEAVGLYGALHARTTDPATRARLRQFLAVALIEGAFKRTCPQPKLDIARALGLLAVNHREGTLGIEGLYNFARTCHEMGMVSRAEPLYRAVIERKHEDVGGVFVRDAAYNLHLIYLHNGNTLLARHVLHAHVAI